MQIMDSFCITTLGACQFPPLAILFCKDEVQFIFFPFSKDGRSGIEAVVTSSVRLFNSFSLGVKLLDWNFFHIFILLFGRNLNP